MEKLRSKPYRPQSIIPPGGRLIQAFRDTDMRCGYDGLAKHAKRDLDLSKLSPGEYVAFFNTARTILKLACANDVIATRKLRGGRYFDLTCISGIIEAFQITGNIDYEPVLKTKLVKLLQRRSHGGEKTKKPVSRSKINHEQARSNSASV